MRWAALLVFAACANGHVVGSAGHEDARVDDADVSDGDLAIDGDLPIDAAVFPLPADPFAIDVACTPMRYQDLVARFPAGGTEVAVAATLSSATRSRAVCHPVTGCTPWMPGGVQLVLRETPAITHEVPAGGASAVMRLHETEGLHGTQYWIDIEILTAGPDPLRLILGSLTPGDAWTIESDGAHVSMGMLLAQTAGTLEFAPGSTVDDRARIDPKMRLCSDGRYQMVTKLDDEVGLGVANAYNRNQIAIHGQI